ncbi:hypothetical protein GXM_04149 [Nostoc sphaeroides CCNUC1]|uniref:Uncharacterized protein n=1 Tax=Nostoc sphaeroides CCNUC1 TaxID=2653204 RepID=A0A5P8W1R6_9NOSO|nr:hypothetical protein GXM_04149 [Nostoc sphaeroides CCNUC1]
MVYALSLLGGINIKSLAVQHPFNQEQSKIANLKSKID